MPTVETTDQIAPRSVLRHRPIGTSNAAVKRPSVVTSATIPAVQRASRIRSDITEDIDEGPLGESFMPQKGRSELARPASLAFSATFKGASVSKRETRYRAHPLFYLGIGMLAMLAIWTILLPAFDWISTTLDDLRYGRPRTFQTDAWVGHNEQAGMPSHFIATNLHRHIEIIEIPGGDASHAHIYVGPQLYGENDELVPVTLDFVDVNGDHAPDMIVSFGDSRAVFMNDQGGFRPLQSSERDQVEQALKQLGR